MPHSPVPQTNPNKERMTFDAAIMTLLDPEKAITRAEWQDTRIFCQLRHSEGNAILMLHRDGEWFKWIISKGDILGADWYILDHAPQDVMPQDVLNSPS